MRVDIWSDVVCPWCYLGKRQFEQALERFPDRDEVEVVYRSFELDPSAPRGETRPTLDVLATKYGMSPDRAREAQEEMEQRAARHGLDFHLDGQRSGNTRDAHRLLHLARARGRQAELVERLHKAHFTDGVSVFDRSSLVGLAADAGLDQDEALAVLAAAEYSDAIDADEEMARSLSANGVPLFVIDRRYGITGAQPADTILEVLERAWAEREAA
jgi:predicted DsbA family dithiol-disulfide isomerase